MIIAKSVEKKEWNRLESIINKVEKRKQELKPKRKIEIVNPIPQDDLDYMMELIEHGDNHKGIRLLGKLGEGQYGTVYGYKDYAIKYIRKYHHDDFEDDELRDAKVMKKLQFINCIPRLYAVIDNKVMIMSRVKGITLEAFCQNVDLEEDDNYVNTAFNKVFEDALKDIISVGFSPFDLHPKNVMIERSTGLPFIVDLGYFKNMDSSEKNKYIEKSNINLESVYGTGEAICTMRKMSRYIEVKEKDLRKNKIKHSNFHANRLMMIGGMERAIIPIHVAKLHM